LSHRQIHYLDVIHELGHPTLGELASELRLSKPSVTMIVRKLEEGGFVERVPSDEDRRVAHLHLSEKGMQIAAWHDKVHAEMAKYLVKNLSAKEAQSLEALLDKAVFGGST
jgi:DNA-binding MarR family transcriptional regulator